MSHYYGEGEYGYALYGASPEHDPDVFVDVTRDCERGGYSVVVAFSEIVPPTSIWTLFRNDPSGRTVVRGAKDISVSDTGIGSIIDYEAPINVATTYTVVVSEFREASWSAGPLNAVCGVAQYLRDLLDPDVHFTSSFCLGSIEQFESTVRSGVFPVLGRPAPIVVVDTRETETGTLRFISRSQEDYLELKRIFSRGTPLLLQVEQEYNLGRNGVLYFQPSKFTDRWLNPNAKIPHHRIEVAFTVIDAPSYTTIFARLGIPFDIPVTPSPGYLITDGELAGRSYCSGGMAQRFASFDQLIASGDNFIDIYYATDACAG